MIKLRKGFWRYFYIVVGVLSLVLIVPLISWNVNGNKGTGTNNIIEASLTVDYSARKEYLVNEEFDPSGLKLTYNDKTVEPTKDNISYDFTSAGIKEVKVFAKEGNTTYQATYPVEVFGVINLDVQNYSSGITILEDGTVVAPNLKVIANLSGHANEFKKYDSFPQFEKTCFVLNEKNYRISAVKSSSFTNYYNVLVKAGNSTFGFVYSNYESHPDVSSTDRIYRFSNEVMNNKTLTLYVTYNSNGFTGLGVNKISEVYGKYILRNATTNEIIGSYDFKYRVETWTSYFLSEETYHQGLVDCLGYSTDYGAMKVVVDGATYYAPGGSWHKAVLGE